MQFKSIFVVAASLGLAAAQDAQAAPSAVPTASGPQAAVPSDLSGGFVPDQLTMQVSFDGQSDDGIPNGAIQTTQQTQQEPTFALGDSSGVNTEIKFVIFMVDTTDFANRILHYVRADFQATEVKTAIASQSQPQMPWKGPGSLGEQGQRQYTFLMYEQPNQFTGQGMPQQGQPINVQDFVKQNGLQKAIAGQTMVVNVSGGSGSSGSSNGTVQGSQQPPAAGSQPPAAASQPPAVLSPALAANPTAAPTGSSNSSSGSGSGAGAPPAQVTPGEGGVIGLQPFSSAGIPEVPPTGAAGLAEASSVMQMQQTAGAQVSATPSPSAGSPATGGASGLAPSLVCVVAVFFAAGLAL